MTRNVYLSRRRESGPAAVESGPRAESHRTRTIATVPLSASAALVTSPIATPLANTGAPGATGVRERTCRRTCRGCPRFRTFATDS
jgi:hypothetical protein